MIALGSIIIGSFAILGVAALIGIVITSVVPYFVEGRSFKRQKQYSLLSLVITVTFVGTLANGFIAGFMTTEEGLAVTQVGTIITMVGLVFVFLQDGVTVLVASASGLRDHPHIHDLLKLTIWGGPLFGVAVMILLMILYFIPPVIPLFIPDEAIRKEASTYYLISSFNIPFLFLRMITIGFLLGTEKIALWLKMQSIFVVFSFFWNVIFVYAARLGPTGSALADLFSGLLWLGMIIYILQKGLGGTMGYPITAQNLFMLNREVTKKALRACGNLITRDAFWCIATVLPLVISNLESFAENDSSDSDDVPIGSNAFLRATTVTSRAVAVMTLSTLFFQGYAPYLAYIGRYRGARLLSKPLGGKGREFRRLALSLIIQGTIVGAVSLVGASLGHILIPKLITKYVLGAEAQTDEVLKKLRVVWWVLVADITATNLNNVYGSLVWAAQDFVFVRTISISSFFFVYLPPLILGYLSGSLIGLWVAVSGYTFFQLCCYAWRVHTRVLVTPLHMDMDYDKWFSFTIVDEDGDDEREEMDDLTTKLPVVTTSVANLPSSSSPSCDTPTDSIPAFGISDEDGDHSTLPSFPADNAFSTGKDINNTSILTSFDDQTNHTNHRSPFPRNESSIALNSDIT
eukprot:Phypoly_transcript_02066.p1 GENE.Phypoly_transcript_02066~~Phypoly_transcript_02066.p1  ORF type:complete len:631 (+),score=62.13 Phypoly_transcript_02066:1068-2960(+)